MQISAPRKFLTSHVLFVYCLMLAGCSTPHKPHSQADSGEIVPRYWQPYLLYLAASPHPRLYVEMDVVEGCAPSEAAVRKLRDFLTTYCHKPDGIEFVRGEVIPRSVARGVVPEALARKYMKGPPDSGTAPPPAFMCVLFYDSFLSEEPAVTATNRPGAKPAPRPRPPARNPRTDVLPYPVIYMNTQYGPKSFRDLALVHEAGHMLGLAHRTNYAAGFHCLGWTCLMNEYVHMSRLYLGLQKKICQRCVAELTADANQPPPSNLRFVGPVLVRSETGYHVLSLPDRVKLVVGELEAQDCRDFAAAMQAETPASSNELRVAWLVKEEVARDPAQLRDILQRAEIEDPYYVAGFAASRACCTRSGVERWILRDPTADIVEYCRQATHLHPEDDWSYNALAWIKATCTNESLRDGKEAVAAATKACELTGWKNWNWIDTLAAACAEDGDFKRAIALEEQALSTGNPREPDQREMRSRISLYEQSQPFRDTP
jgi:hypothetical protein